MTQAARTRLRTRRTEGNRSNPRQIRNSQLPALQPLTRTGSPLFTSQKKENSTETRNYSSSCVLFIFFLSGAFRPDFVWTLTIKQNKKSICDLLVESIISFQFHLLPRESELPTQQPSLQPSSVATEGYIRQEKKNSFIGSWSLKICSEPSRTLRQGTRALEG